MVSYVGDEERKKKNPYFSGAVEAERASFWGFSRIWKVAIGLC